MATPADRKEPIRIVPGDQFGWTYTMWATTVAAGVKRDLATVTAVEWVTKPHPMSPDADIIIKATLGSGITIPTPANGEILVAISATETEKLHGCGRVAYSVRIIGGDPNETIAYGDAVIIETAHDEP